MPPVLGWTAVTGDVSVDALLLFLIIFVWTPPHFWSLALYRRNEYAQVGIPMLPVTHGVRHTQRQILFANPDYMGFVSRLHARDTIEVKGGSGTESGLQPMT